MPKLFVAGESRAMVGETWSRPIKSREIAKWLKGR